ncbi:hypothetical protein QUF70_19170 [Desulfobacterales bacterium HSG17]|nr:hypothetical protein [Desulfobacterales bacterium HSG17]
MTYHQEDTCIEYFLCRKTFVDPISSALIFSYNAATKVLHVSRFHPELNQEENSKYLSAACFYLLIHHCVDIYSLDDTCRIRLETVPNIFNDFYGRLKDFNFSIRKQGLGNVVELISDIVPLIVDTSMIKAHIFSDDDIPFLK